MSITNFVASASKAEVSLGLQHIKSNCLPSNQLINNGNNLPFNGARLLEDHFNQNSAVNLTAVDTQCYLAAASLMHCIDGWQYLSRSVEGLISGDFKTCVHLSYYSELRSTMSFLATEGIGIFDHVHFCQTSNGRILKDPYSRYDNGTRRWSGYGTHQFVWKCLQEWISQSNKSTLDILKGFYHNGKPFNEWISNIPNANNINVINLIIKDWLKKWAFDIQNYYDDRKARNESSYRPLIKQQYNNNNLAQILSDYSALLRLAEPASTNRFSLLDKHLFKLLFKEMHRGIAQIGFQHSEEYLLTQMFSAVGSQMDISLKQLITSTNYHPIFSLAQNTTIDSNGNLDPLSIFSRALLMLRVATANVSVLFKDAGITKSDIRFLTDYLGVENGFWKPSTPVVNFEDLWDDLKESIDDLSNWISNQQAQISLKEINDLKSLELTQIKQINRAALWGIAI